MVLIFSSIIIPSEDDRLCFEVTGLLAGRGNTLDRFSDPLESGSSALVDSEPASCNKCNTVNCLLRLRLTDSEHRRFTRCLFYSQEPIVQIVGVGSNMQTWFMEIHVIERFSFESRKLIGFCINYATRLAQKLAPLFHPIRSKTKTTRDSLPRVFPRFMSATCNNFEF